MPSKKDKSDEVLITPKGLKNSFELNTNLSQNQIQIVRLKFLYGFFKVNINTNICGYINPIEV